MVQVKLEILAKKIGEAADQQLGQSQRGLITV